MDEFRRRLMMSQLEKEEKLDYLTLIPEEQGDTTFTFRGIEDRYGNLVNKYYYYSIDGGSWVRNSKSFTVTIPYGSSLRIYGELKDYQTVSYGGIGVKINADKYYSVSGSTFSLYSKNLDDFTDEYSPGICLNSMFSGSYLNLIRINNPKTFLPFKTLFEKCYYRLFDSCYSLINVPELPATNLALHCYQEMFCDCASLTSAPKLPATTLAEYCYSNMFAYCTSLVNAPKLPATNLAQYCYSSMFEGCTSLITAPELPAPTLVLGCCNNMFADCSNLNYIKVLNDVPVSSNQTYYWLDGVSDTGTFVKKSGVDWPVNYYGIPSGWTVVNI